MAVYGCYYGRFEGALRAGATTAAGGRLKATVPVTLAKLDGTDPRNIPAPFELMGPGDVERLAAGTIVRRFPSPGSTDAEETKLALVEFSAQDLPWRYTPQLVAGESLRPWLVLVVGVPGAAGLSVRPDGTVRIAVAVQQAHVLASSAAWAHVHQVDTATGSHIRSRLLSPMNFAPDTDYIAAVVPAFKTDGSSAWDSTRPEIVACYAHWGFRTGPKGDFPELAKKLKRADLADLALRGGRPFGRADLTYRPRGGGPASTLPAAGALRVPADSQPDPADTAPPPLVAADVAALQTPITVPDGRDVITAPDYPGAFITGGHSAGTGWPAQLTEDPRLRGAAGLGAWTAIAWQNRIADAAAIKLGDTQAAAEQIRALALGVAASRSLWRRRVPTDPVAALVALAPSLRRLPADQGGTVAQALSGHTPQLTLALLSSAGRRATRGGPARAVRSAGRAHDLAGLVEVAAQCPDPTQSPDVFPAEPRPAGGDVIEATRAAVHGATDDPGFADEIVDRLSAWFGDIDRLAAALAATLSAMLPGPDGRVDRDAVREVLDRGEFERPQDPIAGWEERPDDHTPVCGRVDVGALGTAVAKAIDPQGPIPPAARRVFATLPPEHRSMRPLQVEPDIDIPLWSFLSAESPDWMLPGVGDLAEHEVVGVETNPTFVRALLVGANWQTGAELRWRNVPLAPRSSPLRRFWQRAAHTPPSGPDDGLDIKPIRNWSTTTRLDEVSLAPGGLGSEAVVVFRTPIFRRYPATVVYLYDARSVSGVADWDHPPDPQVAMVKPKRVDPTFTGTIGADVTFFGFPVPASALTNHWVVLEEPPAGYRFSFDPRPGVTGSDDLSRKYAHRRFALPVRVLLGPLL